MEEELFKEVELAGKGTGLVASKDLPPGVLLLSESPLLTIPWWQRLAQFNRTKERRELLSKQLQGLSNEKQERFWKLSDCKAEPGENPSIDGIWRTNNFALGPSGPKTNNGLFLKISRFNHSCRPLAEFSWNPVRKKQEVRVVRPIKSGTEITVSYFSHIVAAQNRASRKKYLQNYYGFPCDCLACTLEREEGEEDDKERAKVVELEDRIKDLLCDDVSTDEADYVKDKEDNEDKEYNEDKEDKEDKERRKHEASEEEDLKSILLAVDLSWERIGLMERRGFKVVTILRAYWDLLETTQEWELSKESEKVLAKGSHLAEVLYGSEDERALKWRITSPNPG